MATEIYRQKVNDLNGRAKRAGAKGRLNANDLYAVLEYCGNHCQMPGCTNTDVTFDHVEPLEHGGLNARSNLGLLCESHNKGKSDNIVPDYRNGLICPDDYVAQEQGKETYKKHDWSTIRADYISTNATLRDLASKYDVDLKNIGERAAREQWAEQRQQITNKIQTGTIDALVKEGISSRVLTAKVTEQATLRYLDENPRVKLGDLVNALKLLGVYEGLPTDRVATTDETDVDDSDIIRAAERVARRADRGRETEVYYQDSGAEEGMGPGWSD